MFTRIPFFAIAAAAVALAAPTLAHDPADSGRDLGSSRTEEDVACREARERCEGAMMQMHRDGRMRDVAEQAPSEPPREERSRRTVGEDPSNRSMDFGG